MATKDSGIRFFRDHSDIAKGEQNWNEYTAWQMDKAIKLSQALK